MLDQLLLRALTDMLLSFVYVSDVMSQVCMWQSGILTAKMVCRPSCITLQGPDYSAGLRIKSAAFKKLACKAICITSDVFLHFVAVLSARLFL